MIKEDILNGKIAPFSKLSITKLKEEYGLTRNGFQLKNFSKTNMSKYQTIKKPLSVRLSNKAWNRDKYLP